PSVAVGAVHTEPEAKALRECYEPPAIGGAVFDAGRVRAFGRTFRVAAFPIGIAVEQCRTLSVENLNRPQVQRFEVSLRNRKLIIGVDRLDYSKGLELRFRAYECLLENYPHLR